MMHGRDDILVNDVAHLSVGVVVDEVVCWHLQWYIGRYNGMLVDEVARGLTRKSILGDWKIWPDDRRDFIHVSLADWLAWWQRGTRRWSIG